jgi:hypothetical protein
MQIDALKEAGCQQLFVDEQVGVGEKYVGLESALDHLQIGDTLVVWRLDRLARSLMHLVQVAVRSSGSVTDAFSADGNKIGRRRDWIMQFGGWH